MKYNPVALIRKKRDGKKFQADEIQFLVGEYASKRIPDYQMSALLMAVYFRGMDDAETGQLMHAMMRSGETLDLSRIDCPVIDKHSTGGVGDKISLILAPLVASCGVCVPMISGRGLGHTGGTLDKLGSIPGFRTDLDVRRFIKQLKKINIAMCGQTRTIAPADKRLYALRDVTATVDSIPLIAASIMSKKLAEDLDGLVLDVKFGNGAFMKEYSKAKELARAMIQIGKRFGVRVAAVMTDMNNPLGTYVGNSLEVMESIEALQGRGSADVMEVTYALGTAMLRLGTIKGGQRLLRKKIATGEALQVFAQLVRAQNGDPRVIDDYSLLPIARKRYSVVSPSRGYIHNVDTYLLGMLLVELGGGRMKKGDSIDPSCGFKIHKKIGDRIKKGECLIEIFGDNKTWAQRVKRCMPDVFLIKTSPSRKKPLIREILT
ncbi:MAG: thymidine phosphorylase [candidate division WOR-3 bacterium]|nr:MAG: thymidine phosphorylase [candidate division WOR-3 bacterium]